MKLKLSFLIHEKNEKKNRQNMSLMSKLSDKVIIFFKDSFSKENIYL